MSLSAQRARSAECQNRWFWRVIIARSRGLSKASRKSAGSQPPATPHQPQRREGRSLVSVPVTVFGFTAGGQLFLELASTRDVSRHGCRIRLRTKVRSDFPLQLRVVPREGPIPDDSRHLPYQIVWMCKVGDSWDVGALAISDADLLQMAFASRVP